MCITVKQILFIKFDVQCGQYFANCHLRQFPRKFPKNREFWWKRNATIPDNSRWFLLTVIAVATENRSCEKLARVLLSHPLNGPFLLTQRAAIVLLDPERHAAVMKRVVALAPDDHAVLSTVDLLLTFRLASQTSIWNVEEQLTIGARDIPKIDETHSVWECFLRRLGVVFSSRCWSKSLSFTLFSFVLSSQSRYEAKSKFHVILLRVYLKVIRISADIYLLWFI